MKLYKLLQLSCINTVVKFSKITHIYSNVNTHNTKVF